MKHVYLESFEKATNCSTLCCVPCCQVKSDIHGAFLKKGGNYHEDY